MKAGWKRVKISDVALIQSGSGFPEKYQGQLNQEIPFYKVSDMNLLGNEKEMIVSNNSISESIRSQLGACIFPKDSIIFPKIGGAIATNKKRITTKNCCVDNNVMGAIPLNNKIESDLLFYFFEAHDLSDFANDAHLPSIKKSTVENWEIVVPESPIEQRRIVSVLDEALEDISIAKANAERNLNNARELFESYLKSVFTQSGAGWKQRTLKEIATTFGRGKSKHRPRNEAKLYGGKYPFIQTGDIRNAGHFITEYSQTYSEAGLAQSKLWPKGTICITIAANIAETGILGFDACFPDSVIGVVVDPDEADVDYVEYLLQSFKARIQALGKGSAQANINMGTFENERFPFPSVAVQKEIVAKLDLLSEETQHLESNYHQKVAALDELKKSLLHKAFSGAL